VCSSDLFFSKHKFIFDILKNHSNKLLSNWNNLLLYGKPGLGKSTFIYRLATNFKMSILSLDLSLYIDKKKELYSIFYGQDYSLTNDGNTGKRYPSDNCIIVLEEFDKCIEKLIFLESIFNYKNNLINSFFKEYKTRNFSSRPQPKKDSKDPNVKYQGGDTYEDFIVNEIKGEADFQTIKEINMYANKVNIVDSFSNNIIRNINDNNKSQILRIKDLLELFQGPIPVKDRIIIATTNYYKQIKNSLPALFRPGRLTPIKFSYLDDDTLRELIQYYFKTDYKENLPRINSPTSQIIELAIKYSNGEGLMKFIDVLYSLEQERKNSGTSASSTSAPNTKKK
jgi:hypothetical protein